MSDIAIRVQNLSKQYRIGEAQAQYKTLRETLVSTAKRLLPSNLKATTRVIETTIWALNDVSFEIHKGDVVGIIGRNGAGKSTLLKVLAHITSPTKGRVEIHGRVGSLLEVGTGFHNELTGRENIYLNGAILGMKKAEIERKFDEIVDFAEIEKFLDTPVKHYSSGMYMRLAFAVAAHLEPEILLVDEVLAVGDAQFQKKCLGKMGEVAGEGRTVLFVSHNMAAIENLCHRTIIVHQGEIKKDASTRTVIDFYIESVLDVTIEGIPLSHRIDRKGTGEIKLISFHIENTRGKKVASITAGEDLILAFGYTAKDGIPLRNVDVGFSIHSITNNQALSVLYSSYVGSVFNGIPRSGFFRCRIPNFPLAIGRYRIGARVVINGIEADWPQDGVGYLNIELGDFYGTGKSGFGENAPLLLTGIWQVDSN